MHVRGKAFRYEVQYPDGRKEIVLDVPRYDFAWQSTYELAEPKLLPKGTKMHCVAHYDNSAGNVANPNPDKVVTWGDQTWDEMMIGYFDATVPDAASDEPLKKPRTDKFVASLVAGGHEANTDELEKLAASATASNEAFAHFGTAVMKAVPQVDRVCLTVVDGDFLEVQRNCNCRALKQLDKLRGRRVEVQQLAVAGYALEKRQIAHQNIAEVSSPDFQTMAKFFSSSMHVPVQVGGQAATLNFWSREPRAFPSEAEQMLARIAKLTQDRK
jgi:hypothetical protein